MAVTGKPFTEIPTVNIHVSVAARFSGGVLFCFYVELALENFTLSLMLCVRINLPPHQVVFLGTFYVLQITCRLLRGVGIEKQLKWNLALAGVVHHVMFMRLDSPFPFQLAGATSALCSSL